MEYSIENIVNNQRKFFRSGATRSIDFRVQQLKKLKSVIKTYEEDMVAGIALDFKKSEFDTYTNELSILYHDLDEAIKKIKRWSKVRRVGTNLINFPARSYIIPEPLGVALVIGAWNYPYQLSLAPIIPAIAAGCTVILKPSEIPSNTSRIMANMIANNFDRNFLAVVEGDVDTVTELLEQRFDKIFFTGSTTVGRVVYQAAAKHLTPVTLELGGKSPAFITENCSMKMSVKRLVWAKLLNSGQTCVAPDYIMVHHSVEKSFLDALKVEIEKTDYSLEAGTMVQIINDKNVERLAKLIDPAKIHYGGQVDRTNRFVEPTVLKGVSFDDPVMQEEVFGPILPVIVYHDLSDAIQQVKDLPRPLSCYVFTHDDQIKERILRELSFGGGAVNDAVMHISNPKLPFGGVGNSGMGAYHGEAGFKSFTHYKSILDKPTWLEFGMKYYPQTPTKLKWIKRLLG